MLDNNVLDVCIGLIFIYLLYSLLATIVQEIIATNLGFRAKLLQKAITRMLGDENSAEKHAFGDRLKSFGKIVWGERVPPGTLTNDFYCHPLIRFLAEDNWHSKPSYITKDNFSAVIVDLLRGDSFDPGSDYVKSIQETLKNGEIKKNSVDDKGVSTASVMKIKPDALRYLRSLYMSSHGDIHTFQTYLEAWFTDTMQRATGWYKRYTQVILFMVGLLIAGIFNVDSIALTQKLSRDPKLRERLVNSAAVYIEHQRSNPAPSTDPKLKKIEQAAADHTSALINQGVGMLKGDIADANQAIAMNSYGDLCVLGWLITALSVSLGAPFWFDLLNKFMNLRGSKAGADKNGAKTKDLNVVG